MVIERRSTSEINATLVGWLEGIAYQMRCEVIRIIHHAGTGHPGGSLSAADMVTALYFHAMNVDPANPHWLERDRFILSKGHACPILYVALALRGFFPMEELMTLRHIDSRLQGHPDMAKTPGVDMTAGPLGCGLAAGVGMALGARLRALPSRIYVMVSDGDMQEGVNWEAAMMAGQQRLANLTLLADYNRSQVDGSTDEIVTLEPLADKWRAFNWAVREIDGNDMAQVVQALAWARAVEDRPTAIVARTVKGKGVSFMENNVKWHGKAPNDAEAAQALVELEQLYASRNAPGIRRELDRVGA